MRRSCKVGRGWVVVMGMDYHSNNEQTATILINALTRR